MTAMRTICVALAWLASVGTAWAHHGVANFDLNKEITIRGTVTRIDLVNPHSWLFLDATGDDGRVVPWRCELRGATVLRRSGWSPEMFKAGTEITITGAPDRFEPNTCYLGSAVFADGIRVDRYGQISRATTAVVERALRHAGGAPNFAGDWAAEQRVLTDPRGMAGAFLPSGQMHVIERFTLDADGRALRRSFIATDPTFFEGEYRGADTVYVADVPYQPVPCDDQSYKSDAERSRLSWILIGATAIGFVAGIVVWKSRKSRHHKAAMWAAVLSGATAAVAAATAAVAAQTASTRQPQTTSLALVGGTLIDGTGGPLVRNSVVLIRGERIEKVGTIQSLPVPAGYEHVSTDGMSVLPGLWDPHVHLVYAGYPNLAEWHKKYAAQIERDIMPATARQFLMSGVTSIRDLGAPLGVLDLKQRINRGEIDGPTVYAAGPFLASGTVFGTHVLAVKDEAEARAAVKRLIGAGVDIIKFSNAEQMAPGVARAIVDEAHQAGKRATAHGRTDAEIRIGLDAGVDEFQHIGLQSPQYPDDIVARIRERIGAGRPLSWSPTVGPDLHLDELTTNPEYLDDPRNFAGLPEMIAADVRAAIAQAPAPRRPTGYQDIIKRKVGQLRALGVEFVFGSDEGSFGMTAAQATWRELDAWVRHLDIEPMTAIRKATLDAARYLGVDRETGSVSEGKYADVIAVAGNPLQHIDVLRAPAIVVKHGRRYK